jgi:hypothetical protein
MVLNKLFFFSAILSFFSLHAQKEMNHLFIEAGGPAEYGSFNYERIIVQKANFTFANRIGLSMNNFKDYNGNFNPTILIPFGGDFFYGKTHHLEVDLGANFSSVIENNINSKIRDNYLSAFGFLGYRYKKDSGSLIFRAGYNPILDHFKRLSHWGSLSIGFTL